jgi:hypothetical protein
MLLDEHGAVADVHGVNASLRPKEDKACSSDKAKAAIRECAALSPDGRGATRRVVSQFE